MAIILIADSSKSSLVMTSEVFKDKLPGTVIHVAKTGAECLQWLAAEPPYPYAMVVVDFDLPDTDGVSLAKIIKTSYHGPVLITAFPDKIVWQAIDTELFGHSDCTQWVKKPIRFEELAKKIEFFLIQKQRLLTRYHTRHPVVVSPYQKGMMGKSKKTSKADESITPTAVSATAPIPQVKGQLVNMSLGGALMRMPLGSTKQAKISGKVPPKDPPPSSPPSPHPGLPWKEGDKVVLDLAITDHKVGNKTPIEASALKKETGDFLKLTDKHVTRIRATIAWVDPSKKHVGLTFEDMPEAQRRHVEAILRRSKEQPV